MDRQPADVQPVAVVIGAAVMLATSRAAVQNLDQPADVQPGPRGDRRGPWCRASTRLTNVQPVAVVIGAGRQSRALVQNLDQVDQRAARGRGDRRGPWCRASTRLTNVQPVAVVIVAAVMLATSRACPWSIDAGGRGDRRGPTVAGRGAGPRPAGRRAAGGRGDRRRRPWCRASTSSPPTPET